MASDKNALRCRRCSECEGQEHHWIESCAVEGPEYECKHCPALCFADEDDDDMAPTGVVRYAVRGFLLPIELEALRAAFAHLPILKTLLYVDDGSDEVHDQEALRNVLAHGVVLYDDDDEVHDG